MSTRKKKTGGSQLMDHMNRITEEIEKSGAVFALFGIGIENKSNSITRLRINTWQIVYYNRHYIYNLTLIIRLENKFLIHKKNNLHGVN